MRRAVKNINELGTSPLPWTHDSECNAIRFKLQDFGNVVVEDKRMTEADARLIAAAPELYEALRGCVAAMETIYSQSCTDYGTLDALYKADSALAKASGESEVTK